MMRSTILIRLELEAMADRLADATAMALAHWQNLASQHAAVELALQELPDHAPIADMVANSPTRFAA